MVNPKKNRRKWFRDYLNLDPIKTGTADGIFVFLICACT